MMDEKFEYGTLEDAVKRWEEGGIVWTVELGGLGPGYEQCIQILMFELCSRLVGKKKEIKTPKAFETLAEPIIDELDQTYGYSGAQVGVAKNLAYHFITQGYNKSIHTMKKDRLIQVDNAWELKPKKST